MAATSIPHEIAILSTKAKNRLKYYLHSRPRFISLPNGRRLFVSRDMSWAFGGGAYYEINVEFWLTRLAKALDHPTFYDVGANLGYYSLLLGTDASQVYSFEPSRKTRRLLRFNLRLNRSHNTTAFPYGLSDKATRAELNVYSSSGNNSLFNRRLPKGRHSLKLRGKESIELVRLDDLVELRNILPPELIKIDIEGGELNALRGATKTISKYHPIIVFEYSEATSQDAGYDRTELTKVLGQFGYVFYGLSTDVTDMHLYPLGIDTSPGIDNLIAIPRTKVDRLDALIATYT